MNRPSSSLSCNSCGQPITFDNKHISQRIGKKIPLDVATNEPHDCPARDSSIQQTQPQQQRRYHQSDKGCGQEIYFDANNKCDIQQLCLITSSKNIIARKWICVNFEEMMKPSSN